ncbi:MAG: transporter substrate-binding domain-containing protein [Burkholderiaceae bacterium]|nr:transporter substrate-binding domain-containing protein [Burkholderiaceae bacterium]
MKRWHFRAAALFFWPLICWMAVPFGVCSAQELQLLTEEYPPMTFSDHGKPAGLAVEVVQEVQRRIGDHGTISVVPWARAYRLAQNGPYAVCFTTMRTAEREHQFKWVGPFAVVTTSFYALRGSGIAVKTLEDAKTVAHILVPREYYSNEVLTKLGFANLDTNAAKPEEMLPMLAHHRGELLVSDDQTLPALLDKAGMDISQLELSFSFLRTSSYLAFSRDVSDAVVARWQGALDDMKRDGSFARIYAKWLPRVTPPGIAGEPEIILKK